MDEIRAIRAVSLIGLISVGQLSLYLIYRIQKSPIKNFGYRVYGTAFIIFYLAYALFDTVYLIYRPTLYGLPLNNLLLAMDVSLQFCALLCACLINVNMVKVFGILDHNANLKHLRIAELLFTLITAGFILTSVIDAIISYATQWKISIVNGAGFKMASSLFVGIQVLFLLSQNVFLIAILRDNTHTDTNRIRTLSKILFVADVLGIVTFLLYSFYTPPYSLGYYVFVDICNACLGIHGNLTCFEYQKIVEMSLRSASRRKPSFNAQRLRSSHQ
jgi:hypothetical protein